MRLQQYSIILLNGIYSLDNRGNRFSGKKTHKVHLLGKGYRVHILTTQKALSSTETKIQYFYWNPQNNNIDISCFKGVEVVINLAGSPIAQRWTKSAKASILNSRVQALNVLANAIKENNFPIKHLISASAIGIYPDSKTNYYQEEDVHFRKLFVFKNSSSKMGSCSPTI